MDGIAIEAKDVQNVQDTVSDWLADIGISGSQEQDVARSETAIQIWCGTGRRNKSNTCIFREWDYVNKKLEVFMMRKVITVLIPLLMILGLTACGNPASQTGLLSPEEKLAASAVNSEEPIENSTDVENMDTFEGQTNESENPEEQ